jgi:glycine cleavage system aminomethyltransferase T
MNLEEKIKSVGGPLELLRVPRLGVLPFPVKSEFSNWRDEQASWCNTAVLFDQSHHMTDSTIEGPDCYRMLSDLSINSFNKFGPMQGKQLVFCSYDGYLIGDAVAFCLADNVVRVVGRGPAHSWLKFHAETGNYKVTYTRDERTVQNSKGRELYRYQVNGPNAMRILEKVNGGPLPDIGFFRMGKFKIGKYHTTGLNHRMSGFPGMEFFGPFAEGEGVRETVMEAGAEFGLTPAGAKAYASVAIESGWIAQITPAVYTGEKMKKYREWLPAASFEGNINLAGSFVADRIEDYYATPWDHGFGFMLKFDHDFIGRAALENKAKEPHRQKAWLYWSRDDVARVFASLCEPTYRRFKYIDMPAAWYGSMQYDRVESASGKLIGLSRSAAYTVNVPGWISLCIINDADLSYGEEVQLVWGEPNGGSANPAVERHVQTRIRATLGKKPFIGLTQGSTV